MKYLILFILLPLTACSIGSIQNRELIKDHREIMINYDDSLIKTSVLTKIRKVEPTDLIEYYWYAYNQINKNYGGFDGFLLDGEYSVFNLENRLITSGYFKEGKKHGTWKKWDRKGQLILICNWNKGLKNGKTIVYSKDGTINKELDYKDGQLHGQVLVYQDGYKKAYKYKYGKQINQKDTTQKSDTTRRFGRFLFWEKKGSRAPKEREDNSVKDTTKGNWFKNLFRHKKHSADSVSNKTEKVENKVNSTGISDNKKEDAPKIKSNKKKKVLIPKNAK